MARRTFHCERMKEANFFQFAVFMTYVILPIALPIPDIVETSMCYNNTQCPAGYHMAVAEISTNCPSSEIYCAPCKEGTFTEALNTLRQCFPHRPCTFNAKILRPGTRTKDTTCQCTGHTYLSVSGDCVPWRKCGIGEGVLIPGNSTHNAHCEECPSGTFSVTEDWSTECQLHTRCEEYGLKTVRKGSRIRDTTCDADPDNESRTIGISAVPFNEVVFPTRPGGEIFTDIHSEVDRGDKASGTKSRLSFGSPVVYILATVICIAIIATPVAICTYRRRESAKNGHGGPNGDRCYGPVGYYGPVRKVDGQLNSEPNGEPHQRPLIENDVNINVNVTTMANGPHRCNSSCKRHPSERCSLDGEESGQRSCRTVVDRDLEDNDDSLLVVAEKCTEDPKENINDLHEKQVTYAVSEIELSEQRHPLLPDDSCSNSGHRDDSDFDVDTVNTKVAQILDDCC